MLWLIMGIGVLNLGLGFLAGVYLGYGPPGLRGMHLAFGSRSSARPPEMPAPSSMEGAILRLSAAPAAPPAAVAPPPQLPAEVPAAPPAPPPVAAAQEEEVPEELLPVEDVMLNLNLAMLRAETKAMEIDTRLHECRGQYDMDTVCECLESLLEHFRGYREEHGRLADEFSGRLNELGEKKGLGQQIEGANIEHAAELGTAVRNLQCIDAQSDLRAAGERLLEAIDYLRNARYTLRNERESAYLSIVRHLDRLGQVPEQFQHDPLTGMFNRLGLEIALEQWWSAGRPASTTLSAAMIDLDGFAGVNAEHGAKIAERLLAETGRRVAELAGPDALVGRVRGQQFVVVAPVEIPALAHNVAQLCHAIGHTHFTHDGQRIPLTATGALAAAAPDHTPAELMHNLDETLAAGKLADRGHAFMPGEHGPELVKSPAPESEPPLIAL